MADPRPASSTTTPAALPADSSQPKAAAANNSEREFSSALDRPVPPATPIPAATPPSLSQTPIPQTPIPQVTHSQLPLRMLVANLLLVTLSAGGIAWLAWTNHTQQQAAAVAAQAATAAAQAAAATEQATATTRAQEQDEATLHLNGMLEALQKRVDDLASVFGNSSDKTKSTVSDRFDEQNKKLAEIKTAMQELQEIKKLTNSLQGANEAVKTQIGAINKSLTTLEMQSTQRTATPDQVAQALMQQKSLKDLINQQADVSARLARLQATLQFPDASELPLVLVIIDGGQSLKSYAPEALQRAVLKSTEDCFRLTSGREFGVVWNRDDAQSQIIAFERHFAADWPRYQSRLEELLQPARGSESRVTAGLEYALNRFATKSQQRRRVVYITYESTIDDRGRLKQLSTSAREQKVELWFIQLARSDEKPDADLAQAAGQTGGQYVAVSSQSSDAGYQRLLELLRQGFGLPPVIPALEK